MTIIGSLFRFSFIGRQFHTIIISRQIIKPSLTPSHPNSHYLSSHDQSFLNEYIPFVTFYPNTNVYRNSQYTTLELKNSLSKTLSKYYPFAGRLAKIAPAYIDCNDHGAEFLEASIDSTLTSYLHESQFEDLDECFPYSSLRSNSTDNMNPVMAVQVNHFECGGVAVAALLTHKVADAKSMIQFFTDWGKMTRHEVPHDPYFHSFPNINMNLHGFVREESNNSVVAKSFMFPNSKIQNLKLKVMAMTAKSKQPIANLTRVEVLTWQLFRCAVAAATKNNSMSFKSTGIHHLINIRNKMIEPLPENSIGNFSMIMRILTKNESEMNPDIFISELKKQKMHFRGLKNIESAFGIISNKYYSKVAIEEQTRKIDGAYMFSSICRYPMYDIDFGWGKPIKVVINIDAGKNSFILTDTPNNDGIEVMVRLGKQDMAIFQDDPDLLALC